MNIEPIQKIYDFKSFLITSIESDLKNYFKIKGLNTFVDLEYTSKNGENDEYFENCLVKLEFFENKSTFLWNFANDNLYLYDFIYPDQQSVYMYQNMNWWEDFDNIKVHKVLINQIIPNTKYLKKFYELYPNFKNQNQFTNGNDFIIVPCQFEENDDYVTFLILYVSNQLIQFNGCLSDEYNNEEKPCFCNQLSKVHPDLYLDPCFTYYNNNKDYYGCFTMPLGSLVQDIKLGNSNNFCEKCSLFYINFLENNCNRPFEFIKNNEKTYLSKYYYKQRPEFYKSSKNDFLPEYLLPLRLKGEI